MAKKNKYAAPLPTTRGRMFNSGDTRNAADPFSAVLPALAALGAVSSIASINWMAQEKTAGRNRPRRKPVTALRDLETCCMGLSEIFRRFQKYPELFCGTSGATSSPMKFGVHGPRISPQDATIYQQIMNDVASMLVLASQNAFDVMCAVEDGDIDAPEEVFYAFGEAQDRLNTLIQDRATLQACVDTGADVAAALTKCVRDLKSHRVESP